MKKFILIISLVSFILSINAQDLIIRKDGNEIETKVIEVGIDVIKYKKFDNQDGPVYSIGKEDIFMIRYANGSKDVFNNKDKESKKVDYDSTNISREGLHLGFSIAPGIGKYQFDDSESGLSFISSFNVNYYFSRIVGIKTGISFLSLSSSTTLKLFRSENSYIGDYKFEGTTYSVGIPLKFVITTGNKLGFYFETGFDVFFPVRSNFYFDPYSQTIPGIESERIFLKANPIVLTYESIIGLNISFSDHVSLNTGLLFNYSFTNYFSDSTEFKSQTFYFNNESKAYVIGFSIGLLFKLNR